MISAFGVDHGQSGGPSIEKGLNPFKAFKAARGGKHAAGSGSPMFDKLAAKHGVAAAAPGGGRRIAATPGKRKGAYKAKSFLPGGGGGARRA